MFEDKGILKKKNFIKNKVSGFVFHALEIYLRRDEKRTFN